MARKSLIEKNNSKRKKVASFKNKRQALKLKINDKTLSLEDRYQYVNALAKLPKSSSHVQVRNRCEVTGRPRGVYRKFGLCRIIFRELASIGLIPGLIKSSW